MHDDSDRLRRGHPAGLLSASWLLLLLPAIATAATATASPSPLAQRLSSASPAVVTPGMRAFAHGSFQAMKGDFWGAIETFRKSAPSNPTEAAAVEFAISKAFFSLSVADSAKVHGEAAVRLDPSNGHYARHLARLAHEMQDFRRAAELYGKAADSAPERTDLLYSQALEYVAADTLPEALDVFSRLLDKDPLDEKALSQVLWLQIALKRYPEAIDTLHRLAAAAGNSEKLDLTLGLLYELNGNSDRAMETYRGIIARDREAIPAWVALFNQRVRLGDREQLLREYRDFDSLPPSDTGRSIEVTKVFVSRSERDSLYVEPASMMLAELVARHPQDGRVHLLGGAFEMSRRRFEAAAVSFATATTLVPGDVAGWEGLVMARLELRDRTMAFQAISRAKRALPGKRLRLSVLEGYTLLHTGSPAKAIRVLEPVAVRKKGSLEEPLLIQANASLAMAYGELGQRRRSSVAYARVLDMDPHNALAMNNLAYLYAEQGIMLQQALQYARNAVLLDPENGVFLDTLGWVHYRLGSYDEAREQLEKAVATGIEESEIFTHLGTVYQKSGEPQKAREMFDKAKSLRRR